MLAPRASRPHMPDYGIKGPDERRGLLPWSWAEERLPRIARLLDQEPVRWSTKPEAPSGV